MLAFLWKTLRHIASQQSQRDQQSLLNLAVVRALTDYINRPTSIRKSQSYDNVPSPRQRLRGYSSPIQRLMMPDTQLRPPNDSDVYESA